MSIQSLRSDIVSKLDKIDPVGAKIRKLKSRIAFLEKKRSITAKEYNEVSQGWLKVKEMESQRKELGQLESSLGGKSAKLFKLSKTFDSISEQYDAGKVDPEIYAHTLHKLHARLIEETNVVTINATVVSQRPFGNEVTNALEQGCMAFFLIMIIIPILFSCSFH